MNRIIKDGYDTFPLHRLLFKKKFFTLFSGFPTADGIPDQYIVINTDKSY